MLATRERDEMAPGEPMTDVNEWIFTGRGAFFGIESMNAVTARPGSVSRHTVDAR